MKIYISGKITGLLPKDAELKFKLAAKKIRTIYGWEAVNPFDLNHDHNGEWESYMRTDIIALMECDGILMMEGWHESKGANIEYNLAKVLNMKIFFENN